MYGHLLPRMKGSKHVLCGNQEIKRGPGDKITMKQVQDPH